ncbi:alpha/beta fold hydrolase [Flavobacteriaceae bacterium Ap0902]|nr:alpha/beta fold hydrolase [Flavobacteriaceae bacterium Ap0902]
MPIIQSTYHAPFWIRPMDLMTIYMAKGRKVHGILYQRERVELPDDDFIDLDWSRAKKATDKCILMLHGLEGSSKSQYMLGVAKKFNQAGFDVCAMNFRSCSGEPNRKFTSYHSGKTDDVIEVLNHLLAQNQYDQLILHGVSLGANVALKLTGENQVLPKELKAVIAISAPIDLAGSAGNLLKKRNFLYAYNFQQQLKNKVLQKHTQFPDQISLDAIKSIKNMIDFDNVYTAPAHGFQDAQDYYAQNSSLQFLAAIDVPTLVLNALNDSFISKKSFPYDIARDQPCLYLETPKYGGHVAFWQKGAFTYNEDRALEFAKQFIEK